MPNDEHDYTDAPDADERNFIKAKAWRLQTIIDDAFNKEIADYMAKGSWTTFEEFDEYYSKRLREHRALMKSVREYYNQQIYS